jgi:hypothetical protein
MCPYSTPSISSSFTFVSVEAADNFCLLLVVTVLVPFYQWEHAVYSISLYLHLLVLLCNLHLILALESCPFAHSYALCPIYVTSLFSISVVFFFVQLRPFVLSFQLALSTFVDKSDLLGIFVSEIYFCIAVPTYYSCTMFGRSSSERLLSTIAIVLPILLSVTYLCFLTNCLFE